jgi:hypothetical protein
LACFSLCISHLFGQPDAPLSRERFVAAYHPHRLVVALALAFSHAQAQETELSIVNVTTQGYVYSDLDTPSAVVTFDRERLLSGGVAPVSECPSAHPGGEANQ